MRRQPMNLAVGATLLWGLVLGQVARGAVLVDQTNIVALPTLAAPSQHSFAASNQALTVTLTDLQTPAAFSSLQIAVTLDTALVGSASVNAATHSATVQVPAAASGTYVIYVIGTPTQVFGSFGVCVAPSASPASCIAADSFSDSLTTPTAGSSSTSATVDTGFTTTTSGPYTITITDAAFPAPLATGSAIVTQGSTQVGGTINAGTPAQLTLNGDTNYSLLAFAQVGAGAAAGLFGITITDPSGAPVFSHSFPVGNLGAPQFVTNPSTQALTLTLTDYGYPAALAVLGAAITSGGTPLGSLTAAGALPLTAVPEGSVAVWTYASASAKPGVYGLILASSSTALLSTVQVVNPPASSGTSFAFVATLPSAGTYNVAVNDFGFPVTLATLGTPTVAQGGTVLQLDANGNFQAQAGVVVVLVPATASQSGAGIFGVTVSTTGTSPQILLDQTQALGGVFSTQDVEVGTSGGFEVKLADLGFPTAFPNQGLAVAVSRGAQVLGKIYVGGSFPLTVTPGQYVLTFIATPGAQGYGLYSIDIASAAPTVTLSSSVSSVTVGETAQLSWNSQNATSCTAAGASGWTGSEPLSGSTAVVIDSTVTLTLTCAGPGGSPAQSSVKVTAMPAASSSGGGGAFGIASLVGLVALVVLLRSSRAHAEADRTMRATVRLCCGSREAVRARPGRRAG